MTDPGLPPSVEGALATAGLIRPGAPSASMAGGRTNRVWSVTGRDGGRLVVKLFADATDNPLFPNTAAHEHLVLNALSGKGLAPAPCLLTPTPDGAVLVYDRLDGPRWSGDPAPVAALLGRVHGAAPPGGLRHLLGGWDQLMRQTRDILSGLTNPGPLSALAESLTKPDTCPGSAPCLVHTDVVPANIVQTNSGPMLIDWQCPAIGDPTEDIASFLSPAMQTLYGDGPLDDAQTDRFLSAYPDSTIVARYRALAPLFHLRMAAYCQWQADRGHDDYATALGVELAALETGCTPQAADSVAAIR